LVATGRPFPRHATSSNLVSRNSHPRARIMAGFTTRPEIRGTFGVVASTALARLGCRHVGARKGRQRVRCGGRRGFHVASGRAEHQRPARRGADAGVERGQPPLRHDLRPGCGTGGRDDRQIPRARARSDPGHRPARRRGAGRLRRLDAAAARPRDDAARRDPGAGDRLCRERLPDGAPGQRSDRRRGRHVPARMAELGRGLSAARRAARAGKAVSQSGTGGDVPPHPG
jgi:hypothetical protein